MTTPQYSHDASAPQCREYPFGSAQYHEAVCLRESVLRRPLGLVWGAHDFDGEEASFHLGAFRGERLVGTLILRPVDAVTLQMRQVAVAPDQQSRGVGSALVRYAEEFAVARGYATMMAHARVAVLDFYRKLQYQVVGEPFLEIGIPHRLITKDMTATRPSIPLLEYDPSPEALIQPEKLIRRRDEMPVGCVLCFFHDVIADLHGAGLLQEIACLHSEMGRHPVYRFAAPGGEVALVHPGIGAPFAAGLMEEVIALGARRIIACGGAGVLDSSIDVGAVLVPIAAVRDEGTSYHYLPPSREVAVPPAMVTAIATTLAAHHVAYRLVKTWTTDAFYRETPARVARRREEGCACVEMETAALCAVAQFRGVPFGQMLYAGDDLGGEEWDHRGWTGHWSVREKLTLLAAEIALNMRLDTPCDVDGDS